MSNSENPKAGDGAPAKREEPVVDPRDIEDDGFITFWPDLKNPTKVGPWNLP